MSLDYIKELYNSYKSEILMIGFSVITILLACVFFLSQQHSSNAQYSISNIKEKKGEPIATQDIYVDISGGINNPDVYKIQNGTRLKDLIKLAGGLSDEVDENYFERTFNLASKLVDQQKIYIPIPEDETDVDIANSDVISGDTLDVQININNATSEELDTLDGVGKVTSEKIIAGRPYNSVEDLLNKKIVGNSVYEKIKNNIKVN